MNFHSMRYREFSGGSSVDQVNTTWSSFDCRAMGVGNGEASTVIEVAIPHTTGSSRAGNARVMLSWWVGNLIARPHHWPHLCAWTVYT